jgi:hypothetical protein
LVDEIRDSKFERAWCVSRVVVYIMFSLFTWFLLFLAAEAPEDERRGNSSLLPCASGRFVSSFRSCSDGDLFAEMQGTRLVMYFAGTSEVLETFGI